jgi:hypothetical protein
VWNHAKVRLARLAIASKEVMKKSFTSILRSIQKSSALIKSFIKMKDTVYIGDVLTLKGLPDSARTYATINTYIAMRLCLTRAKQQPSMRFSLPPRYP